MLFNGQLDKEEEWKMWMAWCVSEGKCENVWKIILNVCDNNDNLMMMNNNKNEKFL